MPTTAKLSASIWFALLGWLAANAYFHVSGGQAQPGWGREVAALIGAMCGWRIVGASAGRGRAEAIGLGLCGSTAIALVALLFFSVWQMIRMALSSRYGDFLEAILGTFDLAVKNSRAMMMPGVWGVLLMGGAVGGLMIDAVARRWR